MLRSFSARKVETSKLPLMVDSDIDERRARASLDPWELVLFEAILTANEENRCMIGGLVFVLGKREGMVDGVAHLVYLSQCK